MENFASSLTKVIQESGGEEPDFAFIFCPEDYADLASCSIDEAQKVFDCYAENGILILERERE